MKRAIDIGPVDAAAIKTSGGKVRLRLLFTVDQLAALLEAAGDQEEGDDDTDGEVKRTVTQCNAPEKTQRRLDSDAAVDAGATPPPTQFVIEGSRAWVAWMAYRKAILGKTVCPTTSAVIDGQRRTGWYFPSLFPPASTGPPKQKAAE